MRTFVSQNLVQLQDVAPVAILSRDFDIMHWSIMRRQFTSIMLFAINSLCTRARPVTVDLCRALNWPAFVSVHIVQISEELTQRYE